MDSKITPAERVRLYRLADPERNRKQRRDFALRHKEEIKAYRKAYYLKNKEAIKAKVSKWYYDNPENIKAYRETYKPKRNARWRERCSNEIQLRVISVLRSRFQTLLKNKGGKKSKTFLKILGCSISDFQIYIESRFEVGMSWENYGEWQFDHIVPCAIFDLSKTTHQARCFHFSNYQPLWALDNQRKHTKFVLQHD